MELEPGFEERWLRLLHLADSALPVGALAHSFGVETSTAEAGLSVDGLPTFFAEWLAGAGHMEAAFCIRAGAVSSNAGWTDLNEQQSSMKPARGSREASLRLGKRFFSLAFDLVALPPYSGDAHVSCCFGLVGAAIGLPSSMVAGAYLHQCLFSAISVCQRLLPLGQTAATRLLWDLKGQIVSTVAYADAAKLDELWNLQPLLEIGSMRHRQLVTRLFIS